MDELLAPLKYAAVSQKEVSIAFFFWKAHFILNNISHHVLEMTTAMLSSYMITMQCTCQRRFNLTFNKLRCLNSSPSQNSLEILCLLNPFGIPCFMINQIILFVPIMNCLMPLSNFSMQLLRSLNLCFHCLTNLSE